MKYILIILLFIFIGFTVKSQSNPSGFPTQKNFGWTEWGWQQSDSGTIIARRDTSFTPRFAGTIILWQHAGADTAYWFHTGSRWVKIADQGAIPTNTNIANASLTANGNYNQNWAGKKLQFDSISNALLLSRGTVSGRNTLSYLNINAAATVANALELSYFKNKIGGSTGDSLSNSIFVDPTTNILEINAKKATPVFLSRLWVNAGSINIESDTNTADNTGFSRIKVTPHSIQLHALDSLQISGVIAATTADSALGIVFSEGSVTGNNRFYKLVKYPIISGSGTVSSVALSMPSAFTVTGSPITTTGTFNVSGAGTSLQYIRGNGTLATFDTAAIPSFSVKVRSLFSGTSPITFDQSTGGIGILNASTTQRGAASFNSSNFTVSSGTVSLADLVTPGSCLNCQLGINSKGQIVSYADGTSFSIFNASGAGDTLLIGGNTIKRINASYGLTSIPTASSITLKVDTSQLATQYDLTLLGTKNSNIGSGYRWAIPYTNNIKTANTGYGILMDSTTLSNTITIRADTNQFTGVITRSDEYINDLYNTGLVVFYDNFKRGTIGANYTTAFPATTVSIGAKGLTLSGTPANYNNYITRNWNTAASNYIETVTYVNNSITSTSYGLAVGIKSGNAFGFQHNVIGGVYQNSVSVDLGKSYIVAGSSYATTINGTGAIPAISAGDTIRVSIQRTGWSYTITTTNLTTGQSSSVVQATTSSGSPFAVNNTGKLSLHFIGGNITIIGWEYRILDRYNADYCFIGNSITFGQAATVIDSAFASRTFVNDIGIYSMTNAGGADYTQSVLDRLNEFYFLKPKNVLLMIGGNDILFGVSSSTWKANLLGIRDSLEAHGINVIHLAPTPRNATNVKPLRDYIDTLPQFSSDIKILKTFDSLAAGTALINTYDAGDGTHLNNTGHRYVSQIIHGNLYIEKRIQIPYIPLNALIATGYNLENAVLTNHGWDTIFSKSINSSISIGAFDSQTPSSNGAVINSNNLYLQSASTTNPGLVNISTQTLAGQKTFTEGIVISKISGGGDDFKLLNPAPVAGYALGQFYPSSTSPNVNMSFQVIPKGTGTGGNRAQLSIFNDDYIANPSNYGGLAIRSTGTTYDITSMTEGTGTLLPIKIFTQGNANQFIANTSGEIQINSATDQGSYTLQNNGGFFQSGAVTLNLGSDANYDIFYRNNTGSLSRLPAGTDGYVLTTHSTSSAPTWTQPNCISGTYTPTITNGSNVVASTAYPCQYMRVGNVITVSGRLDIDPSAGSALTSLGISLPIASALANANEVGGTGVVGTVSGYSSAIYADVVNDRATFEFTTNIDLSNKSWYFSFTYLVIPP